MQKEENDCQIEIFDPKKLLVAYFGLFITYWWCGFSAEYTQKFIFADLCILREISYSLCYLNQNNRTSFYFCDEYGCFSVSTKTKSRKMHKIYLKG